MRTVAQMHAQLDRLEGEHRQTKRSVADLHAQLDRLEGKRTPTRPTKPARKWTVEPFKLSGMSGRAIAEYSKRAAPDEILDRLDVEFNWRKDPDDCPVGVLHEVLALRSRRGDVLTREEKRQLETRRIERGSSSAGNAKIHIR